MSDKIVVDFIKNEFVDRAESFASLGAKAGVNKETFRKLIKVENRQLNLRSATKILDYLGYELQIVKKEIKEVESDVLK